MSPQYGDWALLSAGTLLALVSFAPLSDRSTLAQVRSGVDAIRVDVTVTDRRGNFQTGLTKDDFEIFDNNRPQSLTAFASGESPLRVAFVIDTSSSMGKHLQWVRSAANVFVGTLLPGDHAAIGTLTMPGTLRDAHSALQKDIQRLPNTERSRIWRSMQWGTDVVAGGSGRRAIIMATDGIDTEKFLFDWGYIRELSFSVQTAARDLEASSAQLYVVVPAGASVTGELRRLADDSGGRVVKLNDHENLSDVWGALTQELRHQYLLSYSAPEPDGRLHEITVRVKRPGLNVRARKTYRAPNR